MNIVKYYRCLPLFFIFLPSIIKSLIDAKKRERNNLKSNLQENSNRMDDKGHVIMVYVHWSSVKKTNDWRKR